MIWAYPTMKYDTVNCVTQISVIWVEKLVSIWQQRVCTRSTMTVKEAKLNSLISAPMSMLSLMRQSAVFCKLKVCWLWFGGETCCQLIKVKRCGTELVIYTLKRRWKIVCVSSFNTSFIELWMWAAVSLQTNSTPKNITMLLKILYSKQRILQDTSCVQDCRDNCSEYRASFLSHTSSGLKSFIFIISIDHQLRHHLQSSISWTQWLNHNLWTDPWAVIGERVCRV